MGKWSNFKSWVDAAAQKNNAALLMGKQMQVDRINAKLRAKGSDEEAYLDGEGKLRKRKVSL